MLNQKHNTNLSLINEKRMFQTEIYLSYAHKYIALYKHTNSTCLLHHMKVSFCSIPTNTLNISRMVTFIICLNYIYYMKFSKTILIQQKLLHFCRCQYSINFEVHVILWPTGNDSQIFLPESSCPALTFSQELLGHSKPNLVCSICMEEDKKF